ncbi:MAG TPA: CoA-binding protein [Syntrophorhabdaceae bacterium]|nr:CoA-binding protein [Syntrophorhabdaceae bacterium]
MKEDEDLKKRILEESKIIAVVGLSPDQGKASNVVASYLIGQGYRIIPVNPNHSDILGQRSYPSLTDIPEKIDIVDIFMKAENLLPVVREAVALSPKAIWLQLGIVNEEAEKLTASGNIPFFMDQCIKIEHAKLFGKK